MTCLLVRICAHTSVLYGEDFMHVSTGTNGHMHVCFYLVHALHIVRLCECVLADDQILRRQQQDPQFFCQVTQCPLIPYNPPCLQAGDPCVSLSVRVYVPSSTLVTSANCGNSHNALETHFPSACHSSQ